MANENEQMMAQYDFLQRLNGCQEYSEVANLADSFSLKPFYVDEGCSIWCLARGLNDKAIKHAINPIVAGVSTPDLFYDNLIDVNAISQCITYLFEVLYQGSPFYGQYLNDPVPTGINTWGKLFCNAYCYLSRTIFLAQNFQDYQTLNAHEARALLTIGHLISRYDLTFPCGKCSEMIAYDLLKTKEQYVLHRHSHAVSDWESIANQFIREKEPNRLQIESLEEIAKKGENSTGDFYGTLEEKFKSKQYVCTREEMQVLLPH